MFELFESCLTAYKFIRNHDKNTHEVEIINILTQGQPCQSVLVARSSFRPLFRFAYNLSEGRKSIGRIIR